MDNNNSKKKKIPKVPVVIQLEMVECGAASLDMILAYYKKYVTLEQVRSDCGVSRDGSNALNIISCAQNYGLEAAAYSCEMSDLYEEVEYPCIIHWGFNHFMVLRGVTKTHAYLNDPARGEVKMPIEEFKHDFTGIVLMFKPGPNFVADGKPKSRFGFIRERLTDIAPAMIFVSLTTIIASLTEIIQPGFSRVFYDKLLNERVVSWLYPFIIGLAVFYFLQICINAVQVVFSNKINGKIDAIGSASFMWKALNLPMKFYSQRMVGDVLSRERTNSSIANTIVNTLTPLIFRSATMVFYLVIMLRYSVLLTLISFISLAVNGIVTNYLSKKQADLSRVSTNDSAKLSATTTSGIALIETIKSAGAENGFFQKWSGYQAAVAYNAAESENLTTGIGLIPSIVSQIVSVVISGISFALIIKGEFTLGMLTAFQGYLAGFMSPAQQLLAANSVLESTSVQVERIEDVMNYPEDKHFREEYNAETDSEKLSGNIQLKDVSFGYASLGDPIIKDISIDIKAGSKIAFVGGSGCGKSTITKLISGLYTPWTGEILFDGKPMNQINKMTFKSSLAVVDQDITIFEDTIKNNIRMWDSSIEDFEVILAARDAQIHDDILLKEGGYEHMMREGGKDFSGGQRQRLEIARVLAQDPTIVILDEATSALDAKTEYDVVKAINDRGITCIVVAHRLSTIRDCDEIVVLDKGVIVERGTHDELLALNGKYAMLISND